MSKLAEALARVGADRNWLHEFIGSTVSGEMDGEQVVHAHEILERICEATSQAIARAESAEATNLKAREAGAFEMLDRVRTSLQHWGTTGCDIEVGKAVETIAAKTLARAEAAEGELDIANLALRELGSHLIDRVGALNSDLAQSEAEVARLRGENTDARLVLAEVERIFDFEQKHLMAELPVDEAAALKRLRSAARPKGDDDGGE